MKKSILKFVYILTLSVAFIACDDNDDSVTPAPIPVSGYTTAVDYLEEVGFQGNILLRKGSTDMVRASYGMADQSANISNDGTTKFRIGSMSKAFTSLGVVLLKREGLIESFDQPISDFADDFPFGDQITLRHLLTHSSGLPDHVPVFEEVFIGQNQYFTPEDMMDAYAEALAEEERLLFTPGTASSYSNTNYLLLGLLIEDLAEMPYHEFFQQHVFGDLQMNDTYKSANEFGGNGEAIGYNDGQSVAPYPMEIAFGAGDWASTVSDIEKWGDAWMGGLLTSDEKADVFPSPLQDEYTRFGMGWFVLRTKGKLVYFHGGDVDGFTSLIALYPEANGMLIALSNQEGKRNQLDTMIEVFAEHEF